MVLKALRIAVRQLPIFVEYSYTPHYLMSHHAWFYPIKEKEGMCKLHQMTAQFDAFHAVICVISSCEMCHFAHALWADDVLKGGLSWRDASDSSSQRGYRKQVVEW